MIIILFSIQTPKPSTFSSFMSSFNEILAQADIDTVCDNIWSNDGLTMNSSVHWFGWLAGAGRMFSWLLLLALIVADESQRDGQLGCS